MKIRIETLRSFIFILLISLPWAVSAQDSQLITKIEQALDDGLYKRAMKLCEEAMEDSELRKSAVPYLLGAETLYHIYHDEYLSEKYPDAVGDAIKFLEKAARKDDGPSLLKSNTELLAKVVNLNNEQAIAMYNINKYYKAFRTFKDGYEINGDTTAYFWMGKTTMAMGDTAVGRIFYDTLILMFDGAFAARGKSKVMVPDPYLFYGEYYWDRQKYDSAAIYLLAGRQIFDNNPRLNYYLSEVYKEQIRHMMPSVLLKEKVQEALGYFPLDTVFLHKDNAIHLYLYRKYVEGNDAQNANILLSEFAADKVERFEGENKKFLMKWDGFVSEKASDAVWKVAKYYYTHGHDIASRAAVNQYMEMTADSTDAESLVKRWIIITEFAADKESLGLASLILKAGNDRFPENKDLMSYRRTLALKSSANKEDISEALALRTLLIDEFNESADAAVAAALKTISTEVLEPMMKKGNYGIAAKVAKEEAFRATDKKEKEYWNQLRKKVAKEDFYYNYYETRMTRDSVLGEWINEFEWNGDVYQCEAGDVKVTIQRKVEARINYFRRNAGVPEIVMVEELNNWCQQAALMMESNDKLDHFPQRNWRCYTEQGAKAAKYGLLTKGANTTLAVTSFFADNSNTTLGNRRWLTFPNAREYGHGSTTNYSCVWALDDSGRTDSATYREQFVAWPNEGYLPAMMAFDHWSFSMYRDLKGAKVSMTADGKPIALKQHTYTEGYGMPTLVWTPEIDRKKIDTETKYQVNITLSDGKKLNYSVNLFPFVAEAY